MEKLVMKLNIKTFGADGEEALADDKVPTSKSPEGTLVDDEV